MKLVHKSIIISVSLVVTVVFANIVINLPKVDQSIKDLEVKNAKAQLVKVKTIILNEYQDIKNYKLEATNKYKDRLKSVTDVIFSAAFRDENSKEEIKKLVNNVRYDKTGYFWLNDSKKMLVHPAKPELIGRNISNIKDPAGFSPPYDMMQICKVEGECFAEYLWPKPNEKKSQPKIAYGRYYKKYDWMLATGVYVDDIDKEVDKRINIFIKELQKIIKNTKIGKSGYIYIFDSDGYITVHIDDEMIHKNLKNIIMKNSNTSLFYELVKASKNEDSKYIYKWNKPTDKKNFIYEKIAWLEFIPELNWYIASSLYVDDYTSISRSINRDFIIFTVVALAILILIIYPLFIKIFSPLSELTQIVKNVSKGDYKARVDIKSRDEIGILAYNFNKMTGIIENNIDNLDKKIAQKTKELVEINHNLEEKISEAIEQNHQREKTMFQQSRLAQMGEMISMIAHQWRQPLSAISATSASMRLKAQLGRLDKDMAIELSSKIADYAQHLSLTIDDFRNFFKDNKVKESTSIKNMVLSTLDIVQISLENANIKVDLELNSDKEIDTYVNEVKQVILNIIKNSEDALIENEIKNPYIKIVVNDTILKISDNAGGIPEDIIDKVFELYFSTKTKKDGTGLGLYMSKIIIEEHCLGKIGVKNNENGATFMIEFPNNYNN